MFIVSACSADPQLSNWFYVFAGSFHRLADNRMNSASSGAHDSQPGYRLLRAGWVGNTRNPRTAR
jgi:hypothetical protein